MRRMLCPYITSHVSYRLGIFCVPFSHPNTLTGQPKHHPPSNLYWLFGLLPLGLAGYLATLSGRVAAGNYPILHWEWIPALDVAFRLRLDGLGLVMALLILGIGGFILIYASGYMAGDPAIVRFYTILTLFMVAMLGVVIADNIILLFVFWELTSISSYLLIGFKHESEKSQKSALQALVVTGSGGLVLLAGLILLATVGGSWQISELLGQGQVVRESGLYSAVLLLILIGAFTKSAQFPFHFWLPNAMAAPTPVSAYLHSATMVKAGVYLLARFHPVLGGTEAWLVALTVIGGVTGLLGAWLAWPQTDLKRIMAYTTISALGVLVFLLGLGGVSEYAIKAAVVFLITHSLYKGALFMIAGAIDHETGTREVTQLAGLARAMPITLVALLLAFLSMAGLPPLVGFVAKEIVYEATLESGRWAGGTSLVALLTNVLVTAAGGIILIGPFFKGQAPAHVHEGSWHLWLGPLVLGTAATLAGLFVGSALFAGHLVTPAVHAIAGEAVKVKLYLVPTSFALWHHGAPSAFALSLLTWGLGAAVYAGHGRLRPWATRLDQTISRFGPEKGYFRGFDGLLEGAAWLTRHIQNGHLRRYLLYVCLTLIALIGSHLFPFKVILHPLAEITVSQWLVGVLIVGGVLMVVITKSRLAAVAALGVVGYGISLLYAILQAPDLALTQLSIETLSVILFVLVLYRLPRFSTFSNPAHKARDAALAIGVGVVMAGLVLLVTAVPAGRPLTDYYAANSYLLAKGRNVDNVILVDFRGLDTLVEITVLTVSALGVYALIQAKRRP